LGPLEQCQEIGSRDIHGIRGIENWRLAMASFSLLHGGAELLVYSCERRSDRIDGHLQLFADLAIATAIDIKHSGQLLMPLAKLCHSRSEECPVFVGDHRHKRLHASGTWQ